VSTASDTAPAFSGRDVDDLAGPVKLELPPPPPIDPPTPDAAPKVAKRPTTRAGRRAAAEANKLRNPGTAKADKSPKTQTLPRKATLETRLTGQLVGLGTVVSVTGGMFSPAFAADGILITEHAANVAKALDKVAQDQPQVKAALERMLTTGVWGGLIAAMMPLAVGIAANHGALPAGVAAMVGAQAPEAGGVDQAQPQPQPSGWEPIPVG
jgi:hypothetical protein